MKNTPLCCHAQLPDEAHMPRPATLPADFQLSSQMPSVASTLEDDKPRPVRGRPFRKGFDERRHRCTARCTHPRYRFTEADCSAGFWTAIAVMGVGIGKKLQASGRWPNFRGRRARP